MPTSQYEDVYEPPVMDATFAEKIDELKEVLAPPIPDFVSDAFSVSRAYAVGEYCIYENHFYKFTSAKSAGAWDSTKVQETTLAAEQSSTNSNLTQYRMVQLNITAQTVNPQVGATLLNNVDFTTSTMTDTLSNKTLTQLFSGKTILGVHFMWTNGSGSASVSEYVDSNKVTVGVMNVSSVQLVYSAVRVAVFYR